MCRRTMQYEVKCRKADCNHYLATPQERHAEKNASKHTEETDHIVHLGGVYDSPQNGGFWQDGENMGLSGVEAQQLDMELRASEQAPIQ